MMLLNSAVHVQTLAANCVVPALKALFTILFTTMTNVPRDPCDVGWCGQGVYTEFLWLRPLGRLDRQASHLNSAINIPIGFIAACAKMSSFRPLVIFPVPVHCVRRRIGT